MIITIDGPAGTGKTTIARKVAEKLGYVYFDTGAMYRALTLAMMKEGISMQDPIFPPFLEKFHFEIREKGGEKKYFVSGLDVTDEIRHPDVTKKVSSVAAHGKVREKLVAIQRDFGKGMNSVFEGRDMGSVVFPQAHLKIFLTARPAVRAERRYLETKDTHPGSQEDILNEILERDRLDSTREISPLIEPLQSHVIDTSDLTIEEVVGTIISLVPKKR